MQIFLAFFLNLYFQTLYAAQPLTAHYPTMVQTISNPDGTVSLIQVDPTNTVVTLPDGTQAQLRTVSAVSISIVISLKG